ncbi:hypothetical protein LR066_05695 [candidate division WOR-3 bacterium]|nr:hypothetical protein [candidate division WOR-3 bacterium]
MALTPEEKKKILLEEKARVKKKLGVEIDKQQGEEARSNQRMNIGCATVFAVIIAVIVFVVYQDRKSPTTKQKSSSIIITGDIARLSADVDPIPVGISKKAMDKFTEAAITKDDHGIVQLFAWGVVFPVSNNTKVRILQVGLMLIKIRILEGEHDGKSGWVPREWIKK